MYAEQFLQWVGWDGNLFLNLCLGVFREFWNILLSFSNEQFKFDSNICEISQLL